MNDPTQRFSDRVATYVRARPGYPDGVVTALRAHAGLGTGTVVADVGAGTGIFTRVLLAAGAVVVAVEPNAPMREQLVADLGGDPRLRVRDARAEATGLAAASVDLVTAAQAFHWFDRAAAGAEFRRILRPGGSLALVWNERLTDAPFMAGYEAFLQRWATDLAAVDHRRTSPSDIAGFFAPWPVTHVALDNEQVLDRAGLRDRFLSSSYAPGPGHPDHVAALAALDALVDAHAVDGVVHFGYRTDVYVGRFA